MIAAINFTIKPMKGIKPIIHKTTADTTNIPNTPDFFWIFNLLQIILFIVIINILLQYLIYLKTLAIKQVVCMIILNNIM